MFLVLSMLTFGCTSKEEPEPVDNDTGKVSATFNGTKWEGTWASAVGANISSASLILNFLTAEKDESTSIGIGITSYTGPGTYAYGGTQSKVTFNMKHNGKGYGIVELVGGGGSGTITISSVKPASGTSFFGTVEGTFSGTIKDVNSSEILTITEGKFTAFLL
jgi:Family of unknown function (DUF6252)